MEIITYLENRNYCKRKNELLKICTTRVLTEKERIELDQLITDTLKFQDKLINFD